ncbi:MAG: DNA polymerase III subunit beta [Bacteroidales bacterium]|nr:DNA polymerase III subunit beta [Bacteroidales bacterium]
MKFVVSSTALQTQLLSISRVIASKNSLPILDCFLFTLEGNKLQIVASDTETRMETSLEVGEVEGGGSFAIPAKILLDPLRELPDQPLSFEINDDNLEILIYFHNGKYNFIGQKADVYPEQKTLGDGVVEFNIDVDLLLSGINRTLFATADDELRPVMNGIYLDMNSESITFVASDGHKLVRFKTTAAKIKEERAAFILPKKPANVLKNILSKESGEATVRFDAGNACITFANYTMFCRLIEGRYPNYNSVIPKENPFKLSIDRVLLLNAIKRVSVFSNHSNSLVKMQIRQNDLVVSTQDIDYSTSAEERIECQYIGDEMIIGFKAPYLVEILSNLSSDEVNIALADVSRAVLILPTENEEQEDMLMLLMPMVVND